MMITMRRVLGGLALASMAAALGNASTLVFYANIFNPGPNPTSTGPLTTALTTGSGGQLQAAANAAATTNLYAVNNGGYSVQVNLPQFNQSDPTYLSNPLNHLQLDSVQVAMGWAVQGAVDVTNKNLNNQAYTDPFARTNLTISGPGALNVPVTAQATFTGNYVIDGQSTAYTAYSQTFSTAFVNFVNSDPTDYPSGISGYCASLDGGHGTYNSGTRTCTYGATTVDGSAHVTDGTLHLGDAASSAITNNLYLYEGFGTNSLSFTVTASQGIYGGSAGPNVYFGGSASVAGVMEIIYTYHEVVGPEPMTMSLVGGALIGIAALARRRSKRA
jgi:hypothetical protein